MKQPSGTVRPRRSAPPKGAPKEEPKMKVRLDLKRRPDVETEEYVETRETSSFWRWFGLVALLHVVVIGLFTLIYAMAWKAKPPEQFISLLPEGDVVKGTPGTQEAHKVGPTQPANPAHHASATPPPAPQPKSTVTPPKPPPKPVAPSLEKPLVKTPPPPKPKPKPPKVKVDLSLADAPTPAVDKPKPTPHLKKTKPTLRPIDTTADDDSSAKQDTPGLTKDQIAAKLGDKLDAAGVKDATKTGKSGSANSHANSYADFYAMIRDQVMSQWQSPNLADETAMMPIVQIHVEKNGRVPPEYIHLIQSSGNTSYDESAVAAAKNLGYLHEPLPDGCPPDIPITFKLTR